MKKSLFHSVVLSALILSFGLCTASADEVYATIQGRNQETIGGRIHVIDFQYQVTSPRDPATGQATGKRQHKPIVITKQIDAGSPLLFNALVTNETLASVILEFFHEAKATRPYYRIQLTKAAVSGISQRLDNFPPDRNPIALNERRPTLSANAMYVENVSFVFQKIEIQNLEGKTSGMDDSFSEI